MLKKTACLNPYLHLSKSLYLDPHLMNAENSGLFLKIFVTLSEAEGVG
jgi:hypothetical protein